MRCRLIDWMRLPLLAILAVLSPRLAAAQSAQDSAAAVAQRFLDAVAAERWQEAAALIHPETLRELQRQELERFECSGHVPPPTLGDVVRNHPELPRVAAESLFQHLLRQHDELERAESIELRFPGFDTPDELARLPALDFAARFLESQRAAQRARGAPVARRDSVLGGIREGSWVDVLYRHDYEFLERDPTGEVQFVRPPPKVLRLRRAGDGWRVAHAGRLLSQLTFDLGPGVLPTIRTTCVRGTSGRGDAGTRSRGDNDERIPASPRRRVPASGPDAALTREPS